MIDVTAKSLCLQVLSFPPKRTIFLQSSSNTTENTVEVWMTVISHIILYVRQLSCSTADNKSQLWCCCRCCEISAWSAWFFIKCKLLFNWRHWGSDSLATLWITLTGLFLQNFLRILIQPVPSAFTLIRTHVSKGVIYLKTLIVAKLESQDFLEVW